MPNYGLASLAQSLLTRWEAAQAARYSAWTGASTIPGGVMAVAATAGTLLRGSGTAMSTAFTAATQRWAVGPTPGFTFK